MEQQAAPPLVPESRERLNFNADWLFHRNDPEDVKAGLVDYPQLKDYLLAGANELTRGVPAIRPSGNPGRSISFVQPNFDDSSWRKLNLPHDYAVEGNFNIDFPPSEGMLPWYGAAWYRKHFTVPASDRGKSLFLEIDGAMSYSAVWINGRFVGGWPYGYSSYELDITPYLQFGAEKQHRHPAQQPEGIVALVPGRGNLSKRVAGQNRTGAYRTLGHLSHDAGR